MNHINTAEWQIPVQLHTVDIEVLKLALAQADTRQKDLEATASNITNRVQTLLTVFVGIVVAAMGFFLAHKSEGLTIITPTVVTLIYSLSICYYLFKSAYLGTYIPVGGTPSTLLPIELIEAGTDEDKLHNLYLSLLNGADIRIKANRLENERRWTSIRNATKAAVWMPIVLSSIYLVALYLDLVCCL